jgi:hypothetical protein
MGSQSGSQQLHVIVGRAIVECAIVVQAIVGCGRSNMCSIYNHRLQMNAVGREPNTPALTWIRKENYIYIITLLLYLYVEKKGVFKKNMFFCFFWERTSPFHGDAAGGGSARQHPTVIVRHTSNRVVAHPRMEEIARHLLIPAGQSCLFVDCLFVCSAMRPIHSSQPKLWSPNGLAKGYQKEGIAHPGLENARYSACEESARTWPVETISLSRGSNLRDTPNAGARPKDGV